MTTLASTVVLAVATQTMQPSAERADHAVTPTTMVNVPGGRFYSGAPPRPADGIVRRGRWSTVRDFSIDALEVTTRQYLACVRQGQCPPVSKRNPRCNANRGAARLDHPINCVNVRAAEAYCHFFGARLPTEVEWERAARGTDGRIYPWGSGDPSGRACLNPDQDETRQTCPVGAFPTGKSPYGVMDLAGNVAEWTSSFDNDATFARSRIVKGGGYAVDQTEDPSDRVIRSDEYVALPETDEALDLGFRCAKLTKGEAVNAANGVRVMPYGPSRDAVLAAVRASLKTNEIPAPERLVAMDDWAYFEGRPAFDPEVAALVEKQGPRWSVVALERAPAEDPEPKLAAFRARLLAAPGRTWPAELLARPEDLPYVGPPPSAKAERKAILDAIRAKVGTTSEFKVSLLSCVREWCYFEGREAAKEARQIAALVRREIGWTVEQVAVAPGSDPNGSIPAFRSRLKADATLRLPTALWTP